MSFFKQVLQLLICIFSGVACYFISIVILGVRLQDFKVKQQ